MRSLYGLSPTNPHGEDRILRPGESIAGGYLDSANGSQRLAHIFKAFRR
jgi:hypothetical protein